jgi:hypothetical protein
MLVLKTTIPDTNPNLPVLNLTAREVEILQMNPSAWMDGNSGVESIGGAVSLVRDKTGLYTWGLALQATNSPPKVVISGLRNALRFAGSISNPGALKKVGDAPSFPADGIFTLFLLTRCPVNGTEGFASTGGNVCGNNAVEPNLVRFRFGADNYTGNTLFYNHGSKPASNPANYPINTSTPADFRDNAWHLTVITAAAAGHTCEWDGQALQTTSILPTSFSSAESRSLTVGSADSPFAHSFFGDIAQLILIPGALTISQKNTVIQYLNDVKTDLS